MTAAVLFPHQLYEQLPFKPMLVYLVEDPLYFSQYAFHKQKLMMHRASMKYYAQFLERKHYRVEYIDVEDAGTENLFSHFQKEGIHTIQYIETSDFLLEKRIKRFSLKYNVDLTKHASPNFLISDEIFQQAGGKNRKYLMGNFYITQRKRFKILLENDSKPVGGKWSFDEENRKRIPRGTPLPVCYKPQLNSYTQEAADYVNKKFANNYGSLREFNYPVTHADARRSLDDFLINRMNKFGVYEDAIVRDESVLFHSMLSPALNIGLLSPQQVIDRTLELHAEHSFPLNSLEGFIRQIIGWREFMRGVYGSEGVYLRTRNFQQFVRRLSPGFWNATTGIEPVDNTITKVLSTGYCHHIERLMILGNFMHLCEFHPDDVYRWFMELFIDAYDWVMVPNVYGMSQYADGGLITTKPYVSGSNYILKMSDYKKGPWCEVWDALYWRYMYKNAEVFSTNQRMSMIINLMKKMDKKKLQHHIQTAETYLASL